MGSSVLCAIHHRCLANQKYLFSTYGREKFYQ